MRASLALLCLATSWVALAEVEQAPLVAIYAHRPTAAMVARWCHALTVERPAAKEQPAPGLVILRFHGAGADEADAVPLNTPECPLTVMHLDSESLRLMVRRAGGLTAGANLFTLLPSFLNLSLPLHFSSQPLQTGGRFEDAYRLHDLSAAIVYASYLAHVELHSVSFLWVLEQVPAPHLAPLTPPPSFRAPCRSHHSPSPSPFQPPRPLPRHHANPPSSRPHSPQYPSRMSGGRETCLTCWRGRRRGVRTTCAPRGQKRAVDERQRLRRRRI